jgi:hypothetical protein
MEESLATPWIRSTTNCSISAAGTALEGQTTPIWSRDLASGLCKRCRDAEAKQQAEEEIERARIAQEAADERMRQRQGIPQVYPNGCPNCSGDLAPIMLFGRSGEAPLTGYRVDARVSYYTDPEAEKGFWSTRYEEKGVVRATMCQSCHRVFLHGFPGE